MLAPPEDSLLTGSTSLLYVIDSDKDSYPRKGSILRSPDFYPIDSYKLILEFFYKAGFCDFLKVADF